MRMSDFISWIFTKVEAFLKSACKITRCKSEDVLHFNSKCAQNVTVNEFLTLKWRRNHLGLTEGA